MGRVLRTAGRHDPVWSFYSRVISVWRRFIIKLYMLPVNLVFGKVEILQPFFFKIQRLSLDPL